MSEGPDDFADLAEDDYVRLGGLPLDIATDWHVNEVLNVRAAGPTAASTDAWVAMAMAEFRNVIMQRPDASPEWLVVMLRMDGGASVEEVVRMKGKSPEPEPLTDVDPTVEVVAATAAALEVDHG